MESFFNHALGWVFTGITAIIGGYVKYISSRIDKVEANQNVLYEASKREAKNEMDRLYLEQKEILSGFTNYREYVGEKYVTRAEFKEQVDKIEKGALRTEVKIDQLIQMQLQRRQTDGSNA